VSKASFIPNPEAVEQLQAMGFAFNRCEKALHATGNLSADQAMEWLFQHMEDPDIDAPLEIDNGPTTSDIASPEKLANLVDMMGFTIPIARQALKETGGDVERAVDWIFSHPDATGDFDDTSGAETDEPALAPKELPGKSELPAQYQLNSIICHKGSSVHTG
jgi:ubiquitin carboxyl-terminal hydrolase 5/13